MGKPDRLARAINNIIDNAVSFSPPGGLVEIAAARVGDEVRIRIDDEGPGVPPEAREAIFNRFHSVRPEGEEFGRHSGLGLAIARAIVEGHDGEIDVQDRDDAPSGARFTIRLAGGRPRMNAAYMRRDRAFPPRPSTRAPSPSTAAQSSSAGPSGSGKSDLALRLLDRGFTLVSDDQTIVSRDGDRLIASAPPNIAGKLEIRGIGIVDMDTVDDVPDRTARRADQRNPAASRRQPRAARSSACSPADQHRRHDRFRAVEGRARARSHGPEILDGRRAAPAAPAARHRHVRCGQVDRPRCAGGHGLGRRRQSAGRPARGFRPRRDANAGPFPPRSAWMSEAAASIPNDPAGSHPVDATVSQPELLYLDCGSPELIRRYDETRRLHPLAPDRPAEDGIARERQADFPLQSRCRHRPRHDRPQPGRTAGRTAAALRR